jgi:hypothetical protein
MRSSSGNGLSEDALRRVIPAWLGHREIAGNFPGQGLLYALMLHSNRLYSRPTGPIPCLLGLELSREAI